MQTLAILPLVFGWLNLGGGELLLILVLTLTLFGSRKLPLFTQGIGQGFRMFRHACRELMSDFFGGGTEAGRSLGGIYGKPAAQVMTVENQVAEWHDPATLRKTSKPPTRWPHWIMTHLRRFWSLLKSIITPKIRTPPP